MLEVHIEVVPGVDTDSCLNAIMSFTKRTGKPRTIMGDIGKIFFGAEQEFAEYIAALNKEGIEKHLVQ